MDRPEHEQAVLESAFRPIHYLGSKLRFLPDILEGMDELDPSRASVCDLFSGSGTVSGGAARLRPVVSVDVQEYSRVLCSALMGPRERQPDMNEARRMLESSALASALTSACAPLLALEARGLADAKAGALQSLAPIIEDSSIVAAQQGEYSSHGAVREAVATTIANLRATGLDRGSRAIVTRHFGGAFFSFRQAIDLDVAAHWARQHGGDVELAALLSTASEVVNTVGKQFAQPLRLTDKAGGLKRHLAAKVVRERSASVVRTYLGFLARYGTLPQPLHEHRFIRSDYAEALERVDSPLGLIYADPPYTRDHYSRFYHVLETLALGDEPRVDRSNIGDQMSRGFYRIDRVQSDFCIKSKAAGAFEQLFRSASRKRVPLLLSYSAFDDERGGRPRLLSVQNLVEIARTYYADVRVRELLAAGHSKLTSIALNKGKGTTAELLLSCAAPQVV